MNTLDHDLLSFFEQVAVQDGAWMSLLKQDRRFLFSEDRWCFTLPDLFSFLQQRFASVENASYTRFRRVIYNSPINTAVKRFNAQIVLDTNRGHTDKSVYAMVWTATESHNLNEQS